MSRFVRCIAPAVVLMASVAGCGSGSTSHGGSTSSGSASPNASTAAASRDALGRQLVNRYLSDLQRHDVADLRVFLSPGFQIQRADGTRGTKSQFLRNLSTIGNYKIRGMKVTSDANVVVITYQASIMNAVVGGKPYPSAFSPQMMVGVHGAKGWQAVAVANFTRPVGQPASAPPNASTAAASRDALGRQLVNRYTSDLRRRDVADLRVFLSPAFQIQRADGSRSTWSQVLANPSKIGSYTLRGIQATSAANMLVVTYQISTMNAVINGKRYRSGYTPRLLVLARGAKGWQAVALANFNTPVAQPA